MLLFYKKYLSKLEQHESPDALSKEFLFKCSLVMSYEQFLVSIDELIMLSWQQILSCTFSNTRGHLAFLSFSEVRSSYFT